jgi:sulfoxide reductase heme-binding subunit YedZ
VNAPAVWYLMRGSGIAALLLLTASLLLGVVNAKRWRGRRLPLFVSAQLHRNVSLLAVVFLLLHVLTAALDPDAQVGLVGVLVPFAAQASAFWVGLGALSLDLVVVLVVSSLLRRRIGNRTWRALHWTSYACWPLALAHGVGMGTDAATWWSGAVSFGCFVLVALAVLWRLEAVEVA